MGLGPRFFGGVIMLELAEVAEQFDGPVRQFAAAPDFGPRSPLNVPHVRRGDGEKPPAEITGNQGSSRPVPVPHRQGVAGLGIVRE